MGKKIAIAGLIAICILAAFAITIALVSEQIDNTYEVSQHVFAQYKTKHGKLYESEEEHHHRKRLFSKNMQHIRKHNADPSNTSKMAPNHLSDRTEEEIHQFFTGADME